jgi:hypothetical protein
MPNDISYAVNWTQQLADYRGVLNFDAKTGGLPAVSIPLYIKSHPVPTRNPKVTEVNSIPTFMGSTQLPSAQTAIFYGTPEPLTLDLSGWIITPTSIISGKSVWDPTTDGKKVAAGGTSLNLTNWSYGDLITAYTEGTAHGASSTSAWKPINPSSYVDPYGRSYASPVIMNFSYNYVRPNKKQTFSLMLWLEP